MNTETITRLWAVEWSHINGYQAPTKFVEAKKFKDAIKLAKECSRLADFPDKWSFKMTPLKTKEELIELGIRK